MNKINSKCRLCKGEVTEIINLGNSAIANTFISSNNDSIKSLPLIVDFCSECFNIQLRNCVKESYLYEDYSYITPNIEILNNHYLEIINYLKNNNFINKNTKAIELGSNVGYFLSALKKYVLSAIGVEPAKNIAKIANLNGNLTVNEFFNLSTARNIANKYGVQDIIIARHMFAHNSYPQNLLKGIDILLSEKGVIVIENAYAISTFISGQFDQIYHEHMFYYSMLSIKNLLKQFSFELIDIKESSIHGGAITFIAARKGVFSKSQILSLYQKKEINMFQDLNIFKIFNKKISDLKKNVLNEIKQDLLKGKVIASYGASAKAFTMFSFLELDNKVIKYCIDTTSTKIGKFFPSSNIPIVSEDQHLAYKADTFLLTAWNYKDHILEKKEKLFKKGDKLIVPLPNFEVILI